MRALATLAGEGFDVEYQGPEPGLGVESAETCHGERLRSLWRTSEPRKSNIQPLPPWPVRTGSGGGLGGNYQKGRTMQRGVSMRKETSRRDRCLQAPSPKMGKVGNTSRKDTERYPWNLPPRSLFRTFALSLHVFQTVEMFFNLVERYSLSKCLLYQCLAIHFSGASHGTKGPQSIVPYLLLGSGTEKRSSRGNVTTVNMHEAR